MAAAAPAGPDAAEPSTEPQEAEPPQSDSALIAAAARGDAADVRRLLAEGADAAVQVRQQWRMIVSALQSPSSPSSKCLSHACCLFKVEQRHKLGARSLTLSPCTSQADATGQSALMAAAALGATDAVEALLEAGAPWNAIDRQGRCAGDFAMAGDHAGAAGAILEAGATRCSHWFIPNRLSLQHRGRAVLEAGAEFVWSLLPARHD